MKTKLDAAIVVEGTSDVAFLQSFLDAEFITTNGSDVPRETIDYIKAIKEHKQIIVLTDPDGPGVRIRRILDKQINGLNHAFIPKETSIKHGKVGVAEARIQDVLTALEHSIVTNTRTLGKLTSSDLLDLGLLGTDKSSVKRKFIEDKLHLGRNNGKHLLFRLNNLNISLERLQEALVDYE